MKKCEKCGTQFDANQHSTCPKCAERLRREAELLLSHCPKGNEAPFESYAPETPSHKKVSVIRKLFFNLLGFIIGIIAANVTLLVVEWLMVDVLGSLGFFRNLLCWPVDYFTYALSTVVVAEAVAGIGICKLVSQFGKAKYNYSCFVLAAFRAILWFVSLVETIINYGFEWEVLWMFAVVIGTFFVCALIFAENEGE